MSALFYCGKLKEWFEEKSNMACIMKPGKCGFHASSDMNDWKDCTASPYLAIPLSALVEIAPHQQREGE